MHRFAKIVLFSVISGCLWLPGGQAVGEGKDPVRPLNHKDVLGDETVWREHVVAEGETISSLARDAIRFGRLNLSTYELIAPIMKKNNLSHPDQILTGRIILVPANLFFSASDVQMASGSQKEPSSLTPVGASHVEGASASTNHVFVDESKEMVDVGFVTGFSSMSAIDSETSGTAKVLSKRNNGMSLTWNSYSGKTKTYFSTRTFSERHGSKTTTIRNKTVEVSDLKIGRGRDLGGGLHLGLSVSYLQIPYLFAAKEGGLLIQRVDQIGIGAEIEKTVVLWPSWSLGGALMVESLNSSRYKEIAIKRGARATLGLFGSYQATQQLSLKLGGSYEERRQTTGVSSQTTKHYLNSLTARFEF
jgi:hypothetical protein